MARIAGINIPLNKRVEVGLTYIYGIGRSTSDHLLAEVGIEPDRKVRDLTDDEVVKLREAIESIPVEGDLRRRLQGLAQVHPVRRPGDRRLRRPQGHGARAAEGGRVRQGPRLGTRDGDPLAPGRRARGHVRPRRHSPGAQRLPPPEAAEGLSDGPRHRSPVQAVPPGGAEALPQGRALPHRQVRPGDVITMKTGSPAEPVVRDATELTGQIPAWLQADHDGLTAKVLRKPERKEIAAPVQEQLIVELYSK